MIDCVTFSHRTILIGWFPSPLTVLFFFSKTQRYRREDGRQMMSDIGRTVRALGLRRARGHRSLKRERERKQKGGSLTRA